METMGWRSECVFKQIETEIFPRNKFDERNLLLFGLCDRENYDYQLIFYSLTSQFVFCTEDIEYRLTAINWFKKKNIFLDSKFEAERKQATLQLNNE